MGNSFIAFIIGIVYSTTCLLIFSFSSLPTLASNSSSAYLIVITGIVETMTATASLDRTHNGTGVIIDIDLPGAAGAAGWLQARGLVAGAWSADWLQVCCDVRRHAFYHGFVCARVKGGVLTA
jgi:hypothetical protein